MPDKKYDLEDPVGRLYLQDDRSGGSFTQQPVRKLCCSQLSKSCHSPTFNYGEAQAAESTKDFIHKMGIVLKEVKECRTALKVITKRAMIQPVTRLDAVYKETEELVAIMAKSISTAKKNITA